MRGRRKILLAALLLAAGIGVLLFSSVGVNLVRLGIEAASGGEVTIGSSSGRLFTEFAFTDISIGQEPSAAKLRQLRLRWKPLALLQGKLHLQQVLADASSRQLSQKKIGRHKSVPLSVLSPCFNLSWIRGLPPIFTMTGARTATESPIHPLSSTR